MPSQKWSALDLKGLWRNSFLYDKITDGYFAVQGHSPALLHYDTEGKLKNRVPIDLKKFQGIQDIYDVGNAQLELSVIPFQDYYVYVAGSMQRVYVQNRKTGEVQLTFTTE